MKTIKMIHNALLATSLVLVAGGCATSQEELAAQAKITRQQAEQTALAEVPGGKITEAELEKEHGKLVWSFDIATQGTRNLTEIHVDALTGKVVAREIEKPDRKAEEAKEKKP